MKRLKNLCFFCVCLASVLSLATQAQFLPNNKTLNTQSVTRWMQSNRDLAPVMQALDALNSTAESMQTFDSLSAEQQDAQIDKFLADHQLLTQAQQLVKKHGWKSVGEYMRLSTRLGNAIAAYFTFGQLDHPTPDQLKALREKTDPAILAVASEDIAFVKNNEPMLRAYIQAYAEGQQ